MSCEVNFRICVEIMDARKILRLCFSYAKIAGGGFRVSSIHYLPIDGSIRASCTTKTSPYNINPGVKIVRKLC